MDRLIERRIVFFIRSYEYTDATLIRELVSEFNITELEAYYKIQFVRTTYASKIKRRGILCNITFQKKITM